MILRTTFLLGFLFLLKAASAQDLGPTPWGLNFYAVKNDVGRVIFTEGQDSAAQRTLNLITLLHENYGKSMQPQTWKAVDVILRGQTTLSNGFVTLAPYRSEFFLRAPASNSDLTGTALWTDLLSIHEYRHVAQYNAARTGVSGFLSKVGGEIGWQLGMILAIPDWLFEGDAVVYETALTPSGRGRLPRFTAEYRAILGAGETFSYDRARFGSYKNLDPSFYTLGYLMNVHGRNHYGNELWEEVFKDAARWKRPLPHVSRNLKFQTGRSTDLMFSEMIDELDQDWKDRFPSSAANDISVLNSESTHAVTHYLHPVSAREGQIYALRVGFRNNPELVKISSGKDEVITNLGISFEPYLNADGDLFVWTETSKDWRRDLVDFSDIYVFNLRKREKVKITRNERYFTPDVSPDNRFVTAVQQNANESSELHVLDITTGFPVWKYKSPVFVKYSFPDWIDNERILFVETRDGKNTLKVVDLTADSLIWQGPSVSHPIETPVWSDSSIYFSSTFEGKDDVFRLDLADSTLFKVVDAEYAAIHPRYVSSQNALFFSTLRSSGYKLAAIKPSEIEKQVFSIKPLHKLENEIDSIAVFEGGNLLDSIPSQVFKVEPYKASSGFWNLHSWYGIANDPLYSLRLVNSDILSIFSAEAGISYNRNDLEKEVFAVAEYGGWLPILRLGGNYSWGREVNLSSGSSRVSEREFFAGIRIPLDQILGNQRVYLNYQNELNLSFFVPEGADADPNHYLEQRLMLSNLRRFPRQVIVPQWGQFVSLLHRKGLSDPGLYQFTLRADQYLPGLYETHSTVISGAYQQQRLGNRISFSDEFYYPRGYRFFPHRSISRVGVTYFFPLLLLHLDSAKIFYLNRIRGAVFADMGRADAFSQTTSSFGSYDLASGGAEITLDNVFLRLIENTLTFRGSYRIADNEISVPGLRFEIVIGASF